MSLAERLRSAGPLLVLGLLALALRGADFGNPIIHTDEQYYALVGSRMWHGALPYIDLWDRKPIGLFLIYAATRLLPGDGIVAYQGVALLFAVGAACAIGRAARIAGANAAGALIAGAAYLVWLPMLSGRAGQSPVFFNLFMALGAALVPFVLLGVFFDHYALPLLPPLLTLAAVTFGRHRRIALAIVAAGLTVFAVEAAIRPDDAPGVRALARVVKANSGHECPYVFIGDAIIYQLADACIPTAYAFPSTLAYAPEQGATGIDEAAEVRRILAHRPPVIVSASRPLAEWNEQSHAAVEAALARDYRPVFGTPRNDYRAVVYLRNDRPFRR